MLKKRILASSMASVMALSSVSVVAFAEEKKDYGEAVTKEELKAYIEEQEAFIENELPEYGTKQGEKFEKIVDHAQIVLEDEDSSEADITAAYQMVKSVKAQLTIYTASQLKALIKDNAAKYDKGNEVNEELQDLKYTEESYTKFVDAYDDASNYVDSEDGRLITDAYIALEDAVKDLSELNSVAKSEFRTALKAYEQLEYKMKNYESWRRGTATVAPKTGTSKNLSKLKNVALTYGQLIDIVYGTSDATYFYWGGSSWSSIKATDVNPDDEAEHKGEGRWIGSFDIDRAGTNPTELFDFINAQYDRFDKIKSATVTSDVKIVAAYEAALDAVDVFNGWKVDSEKGGTTKSTGSSLEKKYRPQLVENFAASDVTKVMTKIDGWTIANLHATTYSGTDAGDRAGYKSELKNHKLTCNKDVWYIKDNKTGLIFNTSGASAPDGAIFPNEDTAKKAITDGTYTDVTATKITKGGNILQVMEYDDGDVKLATVKTNYDNALADIGYVAAVTASSLDGTIQSGYAKVSDKEYFKASKDEIGGSDIKYYLVKAVVGGDQAKANEHNKKVKELKKEYDFVVAMNRAVEDLHVALVDYHFYVKADFKDDDPSDDNGAQIIMDNNNASRDPSGDRNGSAMKAVDNSSPVGGLADAKTINEVSGGSAEWKLITRHLAYRLADAFAEGTSSTLTRQKLKSLIDDAYDIADKTGDSSLFAVKHQELVDQRQVANEWYKEAMATSKWTADTMVNGATIDTVYDDLNTKISDLKKWLADFKYSYEDIRERIATVATAIDKGNVTATPELTKALEKCAHDLAVLEASDVASGDGSNPAFDDDGTFQGANRLKTGSSIAGDKIKPNDFEKDMLKSYEALGKAYETALKGEEKPSGVVGDVDGDGAVTFEDVNAVVAAYLASSTDKKFDVNGDGSVEFDDVNKAVELYLKA